MNWVFKETSVMENAYGNSHLWNNVIETEVWLRVLSYSLNL